MGKKLASMPEKPETGSVAARIRVLIVPGFVVDTYSEIERGLVELSANAGPGVEFVWLVPQLSWKHNRFSRPKNKELLDEPVWVPHLRSHGIPYIEGNISKFNAVSNILLFAKVFREQHVDVVYTHFGFERFWAALCGKLWGKVVVWHERWHSLGTRFVMPKRLFYKFFVDEFISISKFITSTLPRDRRIFTVPNATRTGVVVSTERRAMLNVPGHLKIVLMVANFRGWKRHMLALEICEHVLRERRDVVFVFLGDGEVRPSFLERTRKAGLERHVLAPGYVDNVDDYYSFAYISMLTSYYEPFGNVVLEAMRHSVPVIAFDNGGPSEVIESGRTGFLVKDGDATGFAQRIKELLDSPRLRDAMGNRAREVVVERYSREGWIRQIRDVLENVVHERRGSPEPSGRRSV